MLGIFILYFRVYTMLSVDALNQGKMCSMFQEWHNQITVQVCYRDPLKLKFKKENKKILN